MGDDVNYDDGGEDKEAIQNDVTSTTTTSTEPPKRIGPVIRPFRSNEDLLLALKRRRTTSNNKPEVKAAQPKAESSEEDQPIQSKPESPKLNINSKYIFY